jgi:predicted aspartyl protease
VNGNIREATALIDTGFDGYLVVPAAVATDFPLPAYRERIETASGEVIAVPVFPGTVELINQPGPFDALIIAVGGEFLLGLLSINHFRITFDHGYQLLVEP